MGNPSPWVDAQRSISKSFSERLLWVLTGCAEKVHHSFLPSSSPKDCFPIAPAPSRWTKSVSLIQLYTINLASLFIRMQQPHPLVQLYVISWPLVSKHTEFLGCWGFLSQTILLEIFCRFIGFFLSYFGYPSLVHLWRCLGFLFWLQFDMTSLVFLTM